MKPAPIRISGYDHPQGGQFEFPFEIIVGASRRTFTVQYGKQTKSGLSYSEACTELGAAILHALTCEGLFDVHEAS